MKSLFVPLAALATITASFLVAAEDRPKAALPDQSKTPPKSATKNETVKKPAVQPAKPVPEKTPSAASVPAPTPAVVTPGRSADEVSVRETGASLVAAYNRRDGGAFAAAFTADGEYVDEKGTVFHGRKAIEQEFARFFADNPATSIAVEIVSTRAIAPAIIAADGRTRFTRAAGDSAVAGRCHLVCTRDQGKWLIASLHEIAVDGAHPSHHEQLKQLEWLIGDWIEEGPQSHVHFSCRWEPGGCFLVRDFSVQVGGQKTITGTQRIGYDPLTGQLKTWIFDSAGGYADGYFLAEGTCWIVHTSGVTSDGRMASGTNVFAPIDKHRMAWQAVDRIVGGERISDIEKVTVVKKPPLPTAQAKQ